MAEKPTLLSRRPEPLQASALVQLVQINQPYLQRHYLPYTAGLLQAYVLRHAQQPSRFTFLPALYQRQPLEQALPQCSLAEILGFSVYIWNINYSLHLAQEVRQQRPETLIIFGGPQVPDQAEDFLRSHPFIDVVCHGEGEQVFLELLEAWPSRNWQQIAGISYLEQGEFRHQPRGPRIQDLDQIPSPYLLNLFEPLLRQKPGSQWLALWESNRGCPFSCSFCDWGSATAAKVTRFGEQRLLAEIEWFARNGIHLVYCCDANYGMLKRDLELTEAMVKAHQRWGSPKTFYIQNTKNVTERAYAIQTLISNAGLNQAVTLSLQSVNPEALKAIKRENISLESYHELQQRFRRDGVLTYTDMLIGLPGETLESFSQGLAQVIQDGQYHLVRFYHAALLPNAEMAQPEYRRRYGLETVWIQHTEPFAPVSSELLPESQEIVIATSSLSRADWRKLRSIAWWAEFLYFNRKLLQLPLALIQLAGLGYEQIFDFLIAGNWPQTSVWSGIREFFERKALEIQQGQPELCKTQVLGQGEVWLSVEDYLFSGLSYTKAWSLFFEESHSILSSLLRHYRSSLPQGVLEDAIRVSACLLNVVLHDQPFELQVSSNLWQVYQGILQNQPVSWQAWQGRLIRDWKGAPFHTLKLSDVKMGLVN